MKKLLSATLALAIGATCIGTLAACNTDDTTKDTETAKKAIATLRSVYADKSEITDTDYDVMATTVVDSTTYNVNWTAIPDASVTIDNFDTYVKVGAPNGSKVTVSITKADVELKYTLKASVTVGSATESIEFSRKVTAKAAVHDGTRENPYSVANVKEITAGMTAKSKLEASDNPQLVYIKGYIIDLSTLNTSNPSRLNYLYIVDEYEAGKKADKYGDALCIYTLTYNEVLKSAAELVEGSEITISGYIMNYKPNNGDPYAEVTYYGDDVVSCVAYNAKELTADEKAQAALDSFTVPATVTDNITIPEGITISSDNTAVISNTGVVTRPAVGASDVTVKLTVSATVDGATKTKEVTVTVKAQVDTSNGGTATLNMNTYAADNSMSNGTAYMTLKVDDNITATASGTAVGTYSLNTGKYYENNITSPKDGVGNWRFYQTESPSLTISAATGYKIVSVKITYASDKTGTLASADKSTKIASGTVVDVDAASISFTVDNTTDGVTNGQVRVTDIEVIYVAA